VLHHPVGLFEFRIIRPADFFFNRLFAFCSRPEWIATAAQRSKEKSANVRPVPARPPDDPVSDPKKNFRSAQPKRQQPVKAAALKAIQF